MRQLLYFSFLLISFTSSYSQVRQENEESEEERKTPLRRVKNEDKKAGEEVTTDEPKAPLSRVTFGFAAGYNRTFDRAYDYSLTTDASHSLKLQPLSRSAFIISSTLSIKVRQLATGKTTNSLFVYNKSDQKYEFASGFVENFFQRLAINVSFNLIEVGNGDVSFNKSIDGGLGLGFFVNDYLQIAPFYDFKSIRQLRNYVVSTYQDKSIPTGSGNEIYNALDTKDDKLFYSKTYTGFSLKFIFSLGNKKE